MQMIKIAMMYDYLRDIIWENKYNMNSRSKVSNKTCVRSWMTYSALKQERKQTPIKNNGNQELKVHHLQHSAG